MAQYGFYLLECVSGIPTIAFLRIPTLEHIPNLYRGAHIAGVANFLLILYHFFQHWVRDVATLEGRCFGCESYTVKDVGPVVKP